MNTMATTLNNQNQDLLAKFLPPNTDARVISHYLGLLAESEQRLRREISELRAAGKFASPEIATLNDTSKGNANHPASKSAPVKVISRRKSVDEKKSTEFSPKSVAEFNYQAGLKHMNASGKANLTRAVDCFLTADAYGHAEASVARHALN